MAGLEDNTGPKGLVETSLDESGIPVIRIIGDVDLANAESLEVAMEPVVSARPERLVVDLGDLDFMDSSGIALLLRCAHRAGCVQLRHPSQIIRRTVESMGLADVLHLDP
jgi:anti-sigma B factor antagonist